MENQIINETSIEDILKDDNEAIKWLNSIDDPKFKNILNILYKYAKECLRDLSKKDLTKGLDKEAKKEIIEKVKQYITKQKVFRDKCLINSSNNIWDINEKFRLEIFNEEELKYIETLSQEDIEKLASDDAVIDLNQKEMISKIRKVNRFYNMQLKLAHTARIVKVADEILKNAGEKINPDLKEIILTSALLHDIGRFYQAKEYDTFADKQLKLGKEEYGSGHSKAGYYYSMMDLFRMNFASNTVDKDLLIRTVAGFVVSYHSENNIELEENGISISEGALEYFDEEDLESETLKEVIKKAYSRAEFIQYDEINIESNQFLKKFMREMILEKGSDSIEALGFDDEKITEIIANMSKVIDDGFEKKANIFIEDYGKGKQEGESNIDELVEKLNLAINNGTSTIFGETDIKQALINMADYDVAKSIYDMFKEKGSNEEEKIKGALFTLPLNMVMDADKIDILNQLSTGIYPINYNPTKYKKFIDDKNFIQVSKEEAFKLYEEDKEDVIINQNDKEDFYKYNGLKREDNISPVRSTLWLLNQFIFTNMRNKGSLMLVMENKFIEKTYEQFAEDKNIQEILKPYMAYTLFFLDQVTQLENNLLTPELMKQQCEELLSMYKESKGLKEEYEALFDGDLLKNREQFYNKKKVITVQEIGAATIGVSVEEKNNVAQIEKEENKQKTDEKNTQK